MQKMIVEYQQADGSVKVFGFGQPEGPVNKATGRLLRAHHFKCYAVSIKREGRGGDAVTGRNMGHIPTAYEIGFMTANIDDLKAMGMTEEEARAKSTDSLEKQWSEGRALARELGLGADSWDVKEAFRAKERGDLKKREDGTYIGAEYEHKHIAPVEGFQLRPHLLYAHGLEFDSSISRAELRHEHDGRHAMMALAKIQASREEDPGEVVTGRVEREWPAAKPIEADVDDMFPRRDG